MRIAPQIIDKWYGLAGCKINKPIMKLTKIANPPKVGIGFVCTFRWFGLSVAFIFKEIFIKIGVNIKVINIVKKANIIIFTT